MAVVAVVVAVVEVAVAVVVSEDVVADVDADATDSRLPENKRAAVAANARFFRLC